MQPPRKNVPARPGLEVRTALQGGEDIWCEEVVCLRMPGLEEPPKAKEAEFKKTLDNTKNFLQSAILGGIPEAIGNEVVGDVTSCEALKVAMFKCVRFRVPSEGCIFSRIGGQYHS